MVLEGSAVLGEPGNSGGESTTSLLHISVKGEEQPSSLAPTPAPAHTASDTGNNIWIKIENIAAEPPPPPPSPQSENKSEHDPHLHNTGDTPNNLPPPCCDVVVMKLEPELEHPPLEVEIKIEAEDKTEKQIDDKPELEVDDEESVRRAEERLVAELMRYQCGGCMLSYAVKEDLMHHRRSLGGSCLNSFRFRCDACGKLFTKKHAVQSHVQVHATVRAYECTTCKLKFKHRATALKHCTNKKKNLFPCAHCGKSYQSLCSLEMHNRIHTGVKPYQCAICERKFTHKYNMLRHVETRHAKPKKLDCDVCGKKFRIESRLKYHMRVHWTDKKPFKCEHCHKTYSHKQNIERHYRKKHPTVEYIAPATDAELACKAWEATMKQEDMIIPDDIETPADMEGEGGTSEIVQPELVMVQSESDSETDSSDEEMPLETTLLVL